MSDAIVKNLSFGVEAKNKIFKGIETLTKAVSSTLGASGKCVILEDNSGNPTITKDGVTVANSIVLRDPVENMGATLLKEAARKTVKEAGDGTTTATVLAHSILTEAYKVLDKENSRNLKEGIDNAVKKVIKYLEKNTVKVSGKMIDHVATISTNNDKNLGLLIADAFRGVDETGIVIMEPTAESETRVEIVDGVEYDKGLTNMAFVTNKTNNTAELENPLVLLVESPVESIRKIQGVLEYVIKANKPLLIIADCEPAVVSALAMNKTKGNIKVNVINAPTYGINKKDMLSDLALLTGAVVTNDNETIIQVDRTNEEANELISEIKKELLTTKNPVDIIRLEKRLSRLSAKVAVVKVGANSEIELKEKTDRVEDAVCATKAAIKEGIVAGGGIALLNASTFVKPASVSEQVLLDAIKAPFETILKNAGIEKYKIPEVKGKGLDVVTGNMVNMIKSGIVDPLLVTKSALINAASVATTILSTDCVINNMRIDESNR